MGTLLRTYLVIWSVLLVGAALELVFVPELVGRTTAWGVATGWQREVGFWDVGMLVMVAAALRSADTATARRVATALCILNILLGTNHLVAFWTSPGAWGNGVGVLVNYGYLLFGGIALWKDSANREGHA